MLWRQPEFQRKGAKAQRRKAQKFFAPLRLCAFALNSLGALALTVLPVGTASADPGGPPPGWEAPPQLPPRAARPKATGGKPARPACCAYDQTCCVRQTDIEAAKPDRVTRVVEVRFPDLPEIVVKEAPAGGPPVAGAPAPRIIDGAGRPTPWPDDPKAGEVRVMPPGRRGEISWGEGWDGWSPFFSAPHERTYGYGVVHGATRDAFTTKGMLTGKVRYTTLDKGKGDTVAVDYVAGTLEGTPELHVTRWGHVEAAPVTDGFVHAFRGWPPREALEGDDAAADPAPAVTFVLPPGGFGFESKDARRAGGFPPSRFARIRAFATFSLPVAPGRSGLAVFGVSDSEVTRWFARPSGAPEPARSTRVALSASQTSAEPAPRVRVIVFAEQRDP
jgi:hypothetical protein